MRNLRMTATKELQKSTFIWLRDIRFFMFLTIASTDMTKETTGTLNEWVVDKTCIKMGERPLNLEPVGHKS